MAQPDISQILAALAQQGQASTPVAATPQQPPYAQPPPVPYGMPPAQPPGAYLPQPTSTGSVDLSQIKPSSSGAVSIADAIAKAKSIAANRGVVSYDSRADPRRGVRSRSRSRSPPRRDGYGNPYRDERRDDPRRGSGNYRRTPSPDRRAGYGGDSNAETIRVKSSLVGLIIGRNGENLRKVEAESGARVQFVQARDAQQTERQCTITGPVRAREDAKQAIYSIIEENGGSNIMADKTQYGAAAAVARPKTTNPPALREGEHTEQMMVPDKTVGLIIGRGGETIKDVQERSGCHVNIVGENKSINGMRPVNLIGSYESTQRAKELILEIVDSDSRAQAAAAGGASSGSNNVGVARDRGFDQFAARGGNDDAFEEKTIKVPSEAVGMIIGKGGETIKELQRTSGCKINVNQPKPPDITRDVDLSGTRRSLAAAERVIWEKVKTVRDRDDAAGRGGERSGGRSSYESAPPQQAYGYSQAPQDPNQGYGGYPAAAAAQPAYPYYQQQSAPATATAQPQSMDPALYAQLYAQYMAQLAAQGQQPPAPQ